MSYRRNPWAEKKIVKVFEGKDQRGRKVKWTVAKAPGHHSAAIKGWDADRKKHAKGPGRKYAQPHGKYKPRHLSMSRRQNIPQMSGEGMKADRAKRLRSTPVEAAAPAKPRRGKKKTEASKTSRRRKPETRAATRAGKGGARRVRKNGLRRRLRRAGRSMMRHARGIGSAMISKFRRKPKKAKVSRRRRSAKSAARRAVKRTRRNGAMDTVKMGAAGFGAFALNTALSTVVAEYVVPKILSADTISKYGEYIPGVLSGLFAAGVVMYKNKIPLSEDQRKALVIGSMVAVGVNIVAHVKLPGQSKSLAQQLMMSFTGTHNEVPAVPAAATTPSAPAQQGYGVFGYSPVGNYGVFGLGSPLAVEGVIDIPGGGALAVSGLGGDTLEDTVLGHQTKSLAPAPNPFAPGLREGNRGTLLEPHAAEVADSGSLSGNIFN